MSTRWPHLQNYHQGTSIKLITSGEPYFGQLINLIRTASSEIHIQTYIFDPDQTGLLIMEELVQARKRGVKVKIVIDDFGSGNFSTKISERLEKEGIEIRRFGPIHLKTLRVSRRLHHKIAIFDNQQALVGGINIADKYRGVNGNRPWLDFAVMLEGALVPTLTAICEDILNRRIVLGKKYKLTSPEQNTGVLSRVVMNDLIRERSGITKSYRASFRAATEEIIIVASYFQPGYTLRKILRNASLRGVKITLVLSENSDVVLAKRATNYLYNWLFSLKANIYEYQPEVLHGKLSVVDRKWMTVGSYNLNDLSELSSIETNIDILDDQLAQETADMVERIIKEDCRLVTETEYDKRTWFYHRIVNFLAYVLVRLSFRVMFFLTKNDRENVLE